MSVYLGELGRLVELKCPSSQSMSTDDGTTFETTLEGRVKAQVRSARRRTWQVDAGSATPAELASLLAFAGGEWGNGPFVWVSADAPVTNLLPLEASLCGPQALYTSAARTAGPMLLPDGGWAGSSIVTSDLDGSLWVGARNAPVPVLSGTPVTVSAWVLGDGARVRLHWMDANHEQLPGMVTSAQAGISTAPRRLHATGWPPIGAMYCTLSTTRAGQITRPAATWTDTPFAWQPGEGCLKAVVHGLSKQTLLALRNPSYGRHASASITITEVG